MAAKIKIHRGGQIGGCVTEISTGKARILIDFGEELPGSKNEEKFEFPWEERPVDAVFFTHYHGDHIGRFVEACQHTHVYMSELSREVLVNIHGYLSENLPRLAKWKPGEAAQLSEEARKHAGALEILNGSDQRVHTFRPHEKGPISVGGGDIRVTPFWVDHSAADACMLLVETADKRILHTGDFRGHGIQGEGGRAICEAVRTLAEEKAIDTLIIEGTMMSRRNEKSYSEEDLFRDADRLFQEHKQVFLIISSTNMDSLQTFYRAAVKWRRPVYVYNSYLKSQLETLGKYASQRWDMSTMEDVEQIRGKSPDQLKDGSVTIIKANEMGAELVKRFGGSHPVVVYSMWPGYYLRKLDTALCDFVEGCKKEHIPVYPLTDDFYGPLHTSGHASPELIAQVIKAADPKEIRSIHTENAGGFFLLPISETLKDRLNVGGYRRTKDRRALDGKALDKFLPGHPYHKFIQMAEKPQNKLAFCFRGNSQNSAVIYYRNHVAFRIKSEGNVEFDFGHARYREDMEERKRCLQEFGYRFKEEEDSPFGIVSLPAEKAALLSSGDLEKLYDCIIPMIDHFSDQEGLLEKQVQQQLFLACKETVNGYCFYDMEFSQPYGKLLGCKNQPDMLAIRFDGAGKPERLVFVEVKSAVQAMYGASGLADHIRGMEAYPDFLLPVRGRDAYHILTQYIKLGLLERPSRPLDGAEFEKLPKEILLILTGKDTLDTLESLKQYDAALLRDYTLATDMFSQLPEIGPAAIYRREL